MHIHTNRRDNRLLLIMATLMTLPAAESQTGRIPALAKQATQDGKTEITIPGLLGYDAPIVLSLAQALHSYTPLLVRVGQHQTTVTEDGNLLRTWYVARVLNNLTGATLPPDGFDVLQHVPTAFQHLESDIVLVKTIGGTTVINGITVNMPEEPFALTAEQQYLVFVQFDDTPPSHKTRVAQLGMGAEAVYIYNESTGHFRPAGDARHPFVVDLLRRTSGQLSVFRALVFRNTQ